MSAINIFIEFLILILVLDIRISVSQYSKDWGDKYESNICPKLYPKKFVNYAPAGNLTAGNFTDKSELKGLKQCVMACCVADTCNVVFIVGGHCYHVQCVSNEMCRPLPRASHHDHVSMILVKPVLSNENWSDILDQSNYRDSNSNTKIALEEEPIYPPYSTRGNNILPEDDDSKLLSHFISDLPSMDDDDARPFENNDSDMVLDASTFLEKVACEVGMTEDCPFNAECVPFTHKTRNGICKCLPGYLETGRGICVQAMRPLGISTADAIKKDDFTGEARAEDMIETTSQRTVQKLTVSILSKQIQLPDKEVTLAAYPIPDEKATMDHYNYVWTLVEQPKGGFTGNMNQNGATVTLSDLTEGYYQFKVAVNGSTHYGEGVANVTVLPPQRTNKPPQVVITPQTQTVKLPNSVAVLDGSSSKDDDAIIAWHWDLTSGPIGYQPPLPDGATLVLNDLKKPGNYTFKLTVEDSDHVKNSTTANITVLNHIDYPPEANAGHDVIIYLPNNNLTLNGSLSTDDHEISSWEWTKSAEDENKAVDMQNTHSPYLQLSNLSEGVYTFVLKVTDSSNQSSTAEVHVFVKPPTNTPPVADAGVDQLISLPQTWAILNGTPSHDDHRIVAYTWRCVEGPTNASISGYNESVANVTDLTKGQYTFALTVLDDNANSAVDYVTVTVTQNKNSPPKADAGGDQVLTLPLAVLILNGSKSSDDFRIVSWQWSRAGNGLAAGTVILHSHTTPVLMLTNIEQGRYVFELTVTDDQGESSRDTVSVQVKPDPLEMNLLEMTLNIPISQFTQTQLDSLVQKMTLLLTQDVTVNVTQVRGEIDSGNTQIIFFLSEKGTAMAGIPALHLARTAAGGAVAGARVRSVRCLSACSGRGVCDHAARACRCDAAWMQSLFNQLDPNALPDCDWSVVYFSLGSVALLTALCGGVCGCARLARRACTRAPRAHRAQRPKYRLLPNKEQEDKPLANKELSETETDSDVLFETKTKTTSFTTRNGDVPNGRRKNGLHKGRLVNINT